jgi:S1-C subfamily serine protease
MVTGITPGSAAQKSNIQKGFVIVNVNDEPVNSVTDFQNIASQASDGVQIGGIYPGRRGMYYYGLNGDSNY